MRHLAKSFALCVDNTDYKASLIPGKVYRIIPGTRLAPSVVLTSLSPRAKTVRLGFVWADWHASIPVYVQHHNSISRRRGYEPMLWSLAIQHHQIAG